MPLPASAPAEIVEVAEASYHRCHGDAFFRSFYQRLLATDPRIPPMFERTDFTKQTKLLQHSIGLLFVYARRGNPAILDRIAVRHGSRQVNVPADMYPLWVDSLVATVREYDARCTPAVEEAWRQAVAPGVAYLISRYDAPPAAEPGSP